MQLGMPVDVLASSPGERDVCVANSTCGIMTIAVWTRFDPVAGSVRTASSTALRASLRIVPMSQTGPRKLHDALNLRVQGSTG